MLTTLLLAMAVTGQSDYNLLAQENVPAAQATVRTATGDYADEKVAALADARAKVRAYSRGLAEARAQVKALTQDIATEQPPRVRIEYADEPPVRATIQAPVIYQDAPVIRTAPVRRYSASVIQSAPVTTYSTSPVITYEPPVTYATAAPVTYATTPAITYATAAPVTYATAAPVMSLGSGVSTYQENTRTGLFGRIRQNVRMTSSGFGAAPTTFGSGFFGSSFSGAGGTVCVSGNCR